MCPAILKADQRKYVSRQRERDRVKYGNGLAPLALLAAPLIRALWSNGQPTGSALYLPNRSRSGTDGEGLGDVISFLSNNASAIKNIAGAVSAGVETAGKVATTTTDIIRRLRELKTQGMTNEALDKVIEAGRFRAPAASGGANQNSSGPPLASLAVSGTSTDGSVATGVKQGNGFFYVK
jgi:hypothetical protein